ncbi:hypothetical protein [Streptomyces sp. NPDC056883]|uniref:hypothetical protein n=1 Tax=Streptomyces sp. NPDC056883 TaxID=3345959 RepID=UPI003677E432
MGWTSTLKDTARAGLRIERTRLEPLLTWSLGGNAGSLGTTNASVMLVTVTLPATVGQSLGQAALMTAGGLVQAALVVLFPIRRWGGHPATRSPTPWPPKPTTPAGCARTPPPRSPRAPSPRPGKRLRSAPARCAAARGLAERMRPVLASLADPAVTDGPQDGPARARAHELLTASAAILETAADAIRRGRPAHLPPRALAAIEIPPGGPALTGAAEQSATRLRALLRDVAETARSDDGARTGEKRRPDGGDTLVRPSVRPSARPPARPSEPRPRTPSGPYADNCTTTHRCSGTRSAPPSSWWWATSSAAPCPSDTATGSRWSPS